MKKVKRKDCPKWKSLEQMRLRLLSESTFTCLVDETKMGFWTHVNGNLTQNKIYCNSLCEKNTFSKFLWFSFDTEKKSWETIKSMNLGRQHVAATVLNGNIYIAGGFQEGDGVKPNSVELYDPKTNEWTNVAPTNKCHGSSALIAFNGFLYTMGGFVGQVERFDPYENSWKEVCDWNSQRRMNSQTFQNFFSCISDWILRLEFISREFGWIQGKVIRDHSNGRIS